MNFHDSESRISLLPIVHHDIWDFKKRIESLHWTAQEIDLTNDRASWATMTPDQQHFVIMQLAFFATIDISVLDNIDSNFSQEINCLEARAVFAAQSEQEWVHTESYGLQIESVIENLDQREKILNSAITMPIITKMKTWVNKWFDRSLSLGIRLIAFIAIEGILFSASFSSIQWLRELNLLSGVTAFNDFIVRDESIHTQFGCLLVNGYLKVKPTPEEIYTVFSEVINIIDEFIEESIPVSLIGISPTDMKQYVRYQADRVLALLNVPVKYNSTNPFPFMDKLTLNDISKTNFFEGRPTQYQAVVKKEQTEFAMDEY